MKYNRAALNKEGVGDLSPGANLLSIHSLYSTSLDSWVRTVKDYGESYQKDPRDAEEVPSF
jgi:hypothetical protein